MPIQNQSCFTKSRPASRGRVSRLRNSEMGGGTSEEYVHAECPLSCLFFRATEPLQDRNIWGSVRKTSLGG